MALLIAALTPFVSIAGDTQVLYMSDGNGPTETFSSPQGIFFDASRNECYIADTGNNKVVVCDAKGMATFEFKHFVTVDGERVLGEPKHIVVDAQGNIYLTDNKATYLDILDFRGKDVARVEVPNDDCGEYHRFDYLAIAPDQTVYASFSCKYRRVAVIGEDFEIARIIDLKYDDDERVCITGLAVDKNNNIYVTDPCAMEMVQKFNAKGKFLRGFGVHDRGKQNFSFPSGIVVCDNGEMWIADTIRQVVTRFSADGEFAGMTGGKGYGAGAFLYPSGLSSDGLSKLFVVERGGNRYQCFHFDLASNGQEDPNAFTTGGETK